MAMLRINEYTRNLIKKIARGEGRKMNEVVEEAVRMYEKSKFFDDFDAAFVKLKGNPKKWEDYQKDLEAWDATLMDGLEEEAWNE